MLNYIVHTVVVITMYDMQRGVKIDGLELKLCSQRAVAI